MTPNGNVDTEPVKSSQVTHKSRLVFKSFKDENALGHLGFISQELPWVITNRGRYRPHLTVQKEKFKNLCASTKQTVEGNTRILGPFPRNLQASPRL